MRAPESLDPTGLATPDSQGIAPALRAHLGEHNRNVVLLAFLTAVAATALWLMLFGFSYWLTLFFSSSVQGTESGVPHWFADAFWIVASGLLVFAWIDRRLRPDDRPRDHKSPGEIIMDFLLATPRVTLAVFSTLTAWQSLAPHELRLATSLLDHLTRERRLRLPNLPQDIPDPDTRYKILFALQLVQVIDIRRDEGEYWVTLNPLRPSTLNLPTRRANTASVLRKASEAL